MQLRVVRAFKSNLEDLEDRRSIHSMRSYRGMQIQPNIPGAFLFNKQPFYKHHSRETSPPGDIVIPVPVMGHHETFNYIDDDAPDDRNDKSRETRI